MKRAKILRKNGQINIKTKLRRGEYIDEHELAIFQAKLIRGLMRPVTDGNRRITYVAPDGISLEKYLKQGITKNDFFLLLVQTLEMTKRLDQLSLSQNALVMDFSYIFVNEITKELSFIYRPIVTKDISSSVFGFIYSMIHDANFLPGEDISFVNGLVDALHKMQIYSAEEIENYIQKVYPGIFLQIKRKPQGESEILYSKKLAQAQARAREFSQSEAQSQDGLMKERPYETFDEEEEEATTLLEEEGTTLLEEEMATAILGEMPIVQEKQIYLIRNNTGARYEVDRERFKIGKDRRFADLYVDDNKAVSRQHADIITKEDNYYLVDLNSTNKTYVNGNLLVPEEEYEIFDGDSLMLGNEGFEFHVE